MTFQHDLIEFQPLEQINSPEGRKYLTPEGNYYPSVTTVLSAMQDKSFLDAWKKRVGEAEATKITNRSAARGTAVHSLCEQFVLNQEIDKAAAMPFDLEMFKQIKEVLARDVDNIRASEARLYSNKLKIAGSVDLVATYAGKPSIIDFKTSIKPKRREWITNYFLQCSIYSYMLWEMTGILHPQIVIIIGCEQDNVAQVFVDSATNWLNEAKKIINAYHDKFSVPSLVI